MPAGSESAARRSWDQQPNFKSRFGKVPAADGDGLTFTSREKMLNWEYAPKE